MIKNRNYLALLVILIITSTSSFAQLIKGDGNVTTQKIDVPYFDEIVVKGEFELEVKQASKYDIQVSIDSNLHNFIFAEVKNQMLFLEVPETIRKVKQVKIVITVSDLNRLVILGAVDAITDTLFLKTTEIFVSGTSNLDLFIRSSELLYEITDVANGNIKGSTDKFELRVTDEALVNARYFEANICDLKASGYSDITLNIKESFSYRVTGVGNVYYYGDPKISNTINSGTALIIRRTK